MPSEYSRCSAEQNYIIGSCCLQEIFRLNGSSGTSKIPSSAEIGQSTKNVWNTKTNAQNCSRRVGKSRNSCF